MFKEWFLISETTAAQFLKRPENRDYVGRVRGTVDAFLDEELFPNPTLRQRYANWFLKELIRHQVPVNGAHNYLNNMWNQIGDYLIGNLNNNQLQSRFNTLEYTYEMAVADSDHWHLNLKADERKKGSAGREVVSLDDVPGFAGWKWVALDRCSDSREGEAMGHCGNQGGKGSNLLSLRDPADRPHLTFINHHGTLGEMKGKGNSKPAARYHLPIVKLLLSDEVGAIQGGGYLSQNNFALSDLSPELQELVRSRKPYIDRPEDFDQVKDRTFRKATIAAERKSFGVGLHRSTPETVAGVVRQIVDRKLEVNYPRMWDMEHDPEPDLVYRHKIFKLYVYFLDQAYLRARQTHPANFFPWMDRLVEGFVAAIVDWDRRIFASLGDRTMFFRNMSNLVKLDEMVHRLALQQPEILQHGPKRSRFPTWDEYIRALRDYLDREGYELPGYRPDNHMVSYEYNQKMAEEIVAQGRPIAELVQKSLDEMPPERVDALMRSARVEDGMLRLGDQGP